MPDMMDRAVELMHDPNFPTVRFSKALDYFHEIQALPQAKELPTVDDELYVKTHRGTFTTDSQVKRDNRLCEVLLMNAEKFSLLASQFGQPYPQEKLQKLWEKVLFGQVHDNIDGSAVAEVYHDAATDYGDIKHDGGKLLDSALTTVAKHVNTQGEGQAVLIFNSAAMGTNRPRLVGCPLFRRTCSLQDRGCRRALGALSGRGRRQIGKGLVLCREGSGNGVQGIPRRGR